VLLPEFVRTTGFRWTLLISGAFAICILLMFVFVYWQTSVYMTAKVDQLISDHAEALAGATPEQQPQAVNDYLREDPRRVKLAGLFDANGKRVIGNIENIPPGLRADGYAQDATLVRVDLMGRATQVARAVRRRLDNGETIVVGRNVDELTAIGKIVGRALMLGLIPALCLSLAAGTLLSVRAQKRIEEVNRKVQRIVAGELRERLPIKGVNDPFDRLAVIVNGMLDEIEALLQSVAGTGDDIAHDLRTPLTRVRVTLERGRQNAASLEELRSSIDQAIVGLDQSLAIITALLRISEIEHNRRVAGFSQVALADLVREIGDLYEPIAEDKRVTFLIAAKEDIIVRGDRDLLFEAIANLVDNAVKFTPEGGQVEISLAREGDEGVVRVRDTGPGIAAAECELVARRFYRSDKSRSNLGLGLGLSLVAAIVKLHGFRFAISPGPGCVVEIAGQRADDATVAPPTTRFRG
jgi:signal transduction histidine kinase